MRVILLYLSYDGTNFCGWQKQEHENERKGQDCSGST